MKPNSQSYHWDEITPEVLPSSLGTGNAGVSPRFTYRLPYGATPDPGGVQFYFFSRNAWEMRILFYDAVADTQPSEIFSLNAETNRWGDIWSIYVPNRAAGALYHIQAHGPFAPREGHRFDRDARLLDPYARAFAGDYTWTADGILVPPKCVVVDDTFDWQGDRHLRYPLADAVIYEVHVRGLTQSPSSLCARRGTFLGLIEKIPYLKSLGISAVELMPVQEFLPRELRHKHGEDYVNRVNYWGYDPATFFAPHHGYAFDPAPGAVVREFKQMVAAMHQAGIEVILDVVFNHTAEGNERGPTLSFRGLENSVYYMLAEDREHYKNYSGCGNTVNGNHPIVRDMIFHCLRNWVHNYHVDGFRFDLASILSRDRNGQLAFNPPVVEAIAEDPMLADTKLIAEAWDAGGAYQVGNFSSVRWAEWNGRYRDDVRRFWRGDDFMTDRLATRLAGSSDLYKAGGRSPFHSINFVTSHDGFPLNDLVTYSRKHNRANGEENRDGDNNNYSCNYGVEGETADPQISRTRARQVKNMLATLLFSQGVPMLLMGDECRRTQRGNNNAYCQDNPLSWFDWELVKSEAELVRFCRSLIAFRRAEPTLRRQSFLTGRPMTPAAPFPDVTWYGRDGQVCRWTDASMLVCMLAAIPRSAAEHSRQRLDRRPTLECRSDVIRANESCPIQEYPHPHHPPLSIYEGEFRRSHHLLLVFHSGTAEAEMHCPALLQSLPWRLFIDTDADSPNDVFPDLDGPLARTDLPIPIPGRTFRCYISPDTTS